MNLTRKKRLIYGSLAAALIFVEVLIALFVHDGFVRPYLGDVIVVVVLYCIVRAFIPDKIRLLPLYLFIFASLVEVGQYFDLVTRIGLGDISFFRILMGTSFSWIDILCYAAGSAICAAAQIIGREIERRKELSR